MYRGQIFFRNLFHNRPYADRLEDIFVDSRIRGAGEAELVDTREDSTTKGAVNEFFLGTQNPMIIQIPNLVYHGWKCVSPEVSLVVNVPSEPYHYAHPDEFRLDPHNTLPYDWNRKDG